MPYKRGAPLGNRNRLVHGHFARTTISLRRACRRTIHEGKSHLAALRTLGNLIGTLETIERMQNLGEPPQVLRQAAAAFDAVLTVLEAESIRALKQRDDLARRHRGQGQGR